MGRKLQRPDSWLHVARVRAGYKTVRSLAERLGVALSQVVEEDRGPQKPKWEHIPKLAEALGLGVHEVITGIWGGERWGSLPVSLRWQKDSS
jgi:transcriptional regulator with XRE-family HTH domain